ncbi:MAG: cupin domain-containing protein [Thermoleophilia bacterium]|nr:cupin domain-containing protein [Thermoleophilia bacterium]
MSEVNLFDVDVEKDADDADGYHVSYARIAPLVGGRLLGLSVYELPPGQSICPYHYEIGFEEWLFVLTGRPTLRTPDGARELRPWDVVFFPDGPTGAHKVTNNTGETLRVAMLSNKGDPGVAIYPDSDKLGAFPPNKLFRLTDAVDYFDGET